ncbi:hypothetical protein PTSG_05737 [Salpingoeca rosetta]|uniref:Uncharacterized protein n=1 Tax=Salpingoeca rosetta (strain ATCC 50818 / BSB-021) TaxID=946362 RepID=F2UB31_SALR5|nr:uncharacterized protein PTSG_05737 [Salpingoeca rosetta]EGD74044.1 hypothetical protein PTSG_05737 [Salpingoeca rosetta]|eukprot:XP_004993606.1 hypothetical protein PTSG_05737 [Salpingoeca rosetta]
MSRTNEDVNVSPSVGPAEPSSPRVEAKPSTPADVHASTQGNGRRPANPPPPRPTRSRTSLPTQASAQFSFEDVPAGHGGDGRPRMPATHSVPALLGASTTATGAVQRDLEQQRVSSSSAISRSESASPTALAQLSDLANDDDDDDDDGDDHATTVHVRVQARDQNQVRMHMHMRVQQGTWQEAGTGRAQPVAPPRRQVIHATVTGTGVVATVPLVMTLMHLCAPSVSRLTGQRTGAPPAPAPPSPVITVEWFEEYAPWLDIPMLDEGIDEEQLHLQRFRLLYYRRRRGCRLICSTVPRRRRPSLATLRRQHNIKSSYC